MSQFVDFSYLFPKLLPLFSWEAVTPNLGGIFRGSFYGGENGSSSCLKIVVIMLETWNLTRK